MDQRAIGLGAESSFLFVVGTIGTLETHGDNRGRDERIVFFWKSGK